MIGYGYLKNNTLEKKNKQTKLDVVSIISTAYDQWLSDAFSDTFFASRSFSRPRVSPFFLAFLSKPVEALDPPTFFLSRKWSFF